MSWPFTGKTPNYVVTHFDYLNGLGLSGTSSASDTPCVLGSMIVRGGTMGNLVIRDSPNASGGSVIAQIALPTAGKTFEYNVRCNNGLAVFASAATDFVMTILK